MATWRILVSTTLVLATSVLGACQSGQDSAIPDATPATATRSKVGDPCASLSVPFTTYATWRPTLTDVRPWSAAEASSLDDRVRGALARPWTAVITLDELPIEVAHTPDHDRVRVYAGSEGWALEVHVAAGATPVPDGWLPMVVCSHGQYGRECVRVRGDESTEDLTGLLGPYLDSYTPLAGSLVARQRVADPVEGPPAEPDREFMARVDSPAGPLDCAVTWPTQASPGDLEGTPLALGTDDSGGYPAWCVDQRGLVLLAPGSPAAFSALTALAPTVKGDITILPAEVSSRVP